MKRGAIGTLLLPPELGIEMIARTNSCIMTNGR